ncbi:MAG TPA: hypothetical protein VF062_19035 [Candidatus Limnocylindrales bacterium]
MDPLGFIMANWSVRDHVESARPTAPIREERRPSLHPLRVRTANALHRLANAIQPGTDASPRRQTCTPIGA